MSGFRHLGDELLHRGHVISLYRSEFESPDGRLVEFIELDDHPYWVATQAHPEFKSRPDRAHPLFRELVGAALARRDATPPGLRRMLNEAADAADADAAIDTSA